MTTAPLVGSKNATSALKCLQLRLESGKVCLYCILIVHVIPSSLSLSPFLQFTIEELILAPRFAQYLSKWEYFTRLGWLDNGKKSVHYLSLSLSLSD